RRAVRAATRLVDGADLLNQPRIAERPVRRRTTLPERARRPALLANEGRGQAGRLRIHRDLLLSLRQDPVPCPRRQPFGRSSLQPTAAPLNARLPLPRRIRKDRYNDLTTTCP